MRVACVHVPELDLQALCRADAELAGRPLALTDGPTLVARVLAVSDEARRHGVRPGMTGTQARAILPEPGLVVRPLAVAQSDAARAALYDAAYGFAPRVEPAQGSVLLEIGDLGRLYPSERDVGHALAARVAALGLDARVGIASRKSVARLAALAELDGTGLVRVVAAGQEAAFLAPLPLALAAPSPTVAEALARWGVRTLGELAQLAAEDVALRLGAEGARLHRLARGVLDEPLQPRAPDATLEEGLTLDYAIPDLEALGFIVRGLVDRVLDRLAARSLACAGLVLRLQLEGHSHDVREIPLGAPTREAATLVDLVRLSVSRRPPGAPVEGVLIAAQAARATRAQLDLFRPAGPSPDRLAQTVARLEALCGDGQVGSPRPVDDHREEAIAVAPYRPPMLETSMTRKRKIPLATDGEKLSKENSSQSRLAFRRFRPPTSIEVLVDGQHTPRSLAGDGLSAHIVVAVGPYRASGEWWSGGGWARDYWDVHASDGALYRLYCDARGSWFLDGYYD